MEIILGEEKSREIGESDRSRMAGKKVFWGDFIGRFDGRLRRKNQRSHLFVGLGAAYSIIDWTRMRITVLGLF